MRSREWVLFTGVLAGLSALFCAAFAVIFGRGAALLCAGACGTLCAAALGFTAWRYREIRRLAEYLTGVTLGGAPVDIRDQRPGELSLLKNDLYQVTTVLESQRAALESERGFLADQMNNIAHQLKTPLAAIQLQAELWAAPEASEETRGGCAEAVLAQAGRMRWLVEKLLKLSQLDADAVRFNTTCQPAGKILRRAAGGLIADMARKQIVFECGDGACLPCRCDAEWTAEALSNLLKNALEHTPEGGRICVKAEQTPIWFAFTVENTGTPVPPGELPHLFERFHRGRDAAPGSVGIGLALARAIARAQNGALTAERMPDGMRFILRLYRSEKTDGGAGKAP